MDFLNHFKAARRVSTPLVTIRTFDAQSTVAVIRKSLGENIDKTPMILWDCVNGMRHLTQGGEEQLAYILSKADTTLEGTASLDITLRAAQHCTTDCILFLSNAHLQWTEAATIQGIWNLRDPYKSTGNMLVMLANPGAIMPTELANDTLVLDEPLPTAEELQAIVRDTYKSARVLEPTAEVLGKATEALIGLPAFPADQTAAMCLTYDRKAKAGEREGTLDVSELWERKRTIISQAPGLSVWRGSDKLEDIGGIEQAKEFFRRVMEGRDAPSVILHMDEIEKAYAGTGTDMSGVKTELTGTMLSWMQDTDMDGCIFTGIPGVSKTQLSKSLGGTYGKPVIFFDLAGMQGGVVGSSGANLRQSQAVVDAISAGRALALATCNSMESLPPELRRRFNLGTFFFDAPSASERESIWAIYRKKFNIPTTDKTPDAEGWTGAEIKECAKKAYRLKMTLVEASQYIVPVTRSASERIKVTRMAASGKYLSASKPGIYSFTESQPTASAVSSKAFPGEAGRFVRDLEA